MAVRKFFSIAPYLPLQDIEGSLRWMRSVEFAMKAVVRGPETSMVDSSTALFDFIEDLRTENGDLKALSPRVAVGLSRLCDEIEDTEEFFNSTIPLIAKFALQLPDLLENHDSEVNRLSDDAGSLLMLRILSPQQSGMVLLHQHLIAALLACAFLCLYPQTRQQRKLGLNSVNFDGLYLGVSKASTVQKLLCLVHYFKKVGKTMPEGTVSFERKVLPLKDFGYTKLNRSFWSNSNKTLCELKVINGGSLVDAGSDYLQMDFANEQLGGGALHTGCVQEEIRFMVCPECIAGMLFLPTMTDNESIEIIGAETYSQYTGQENERIKPDLLYKRSFSLVFGRIGLEYGAERTFYPASIYGHSFRFTGDHTDNTPRDSWGRRKICVGAIDALCRPGEGQFEDKLMIRELNKAYCGFLNHSALCGYNGAPDFFSSKSIAAGLGENLPAAQASEECMESFPDYNANYEVRLEGDSADSTVSFTDINTNTSQDRCQQAESTGTCIMHQKLEGVSTGNWGAGAFGGNLQLKSLLQWLAASQAGCSTMVYYSFGDPRSQRMQEVVDWVRKEGWCVSELWSIVQGYGKCRLNRQVKSELYEWILPHERKESYILRSKTVRFKATAEQVERENLLMLTTHSGRRQLTREVAPRMKTMGCWGCSRRKRK